MIWFSEIPRVSVEFLDPISPPIVGLGVQWDPFEFPLTEAQWKETESRVDAMHLGIIRVCVTFNTYCRGLDDKGNPIYEWNEKARNPKFQYLDRILRFAQKRSISVILGQFYGPGYIGNQLFGTNHPFSIRTLTDYVKHFRDRYPVVRYVNYVNEPNYVEKFETWKGAMLNLRASLDQRGLSDVLIVGPDAAGNTVQEGPLKWLDRTAVELGSQIGGYEIHWYASDDEVLSGIIHKRLAELSSNLRLKDPSVAKPLFLGEIGIYSGAEHGDQQPRTRTYEYGLYLAYYLMQSFQAGFQGAIGWELDDAMHLNGTHPREPVNFDTFNLWGMWNTQAAALGMPSDELPRPWYQMWRLASWALPRGSSVYPLAGLPDGIRGVADVDGKEFSVVMVNITAHPITIRLDVGRRTLWRVDYTESQSFRPTPFSDGTLTLPTRSVVFLSSRKED
jgi:hypothetical protein